MCVLVQPQDAAYVHLNSYIIIWKFNSLTETNVDKRKTQWLQMGLKVTSGQWRAPHPGGVLYLVGMGGAVYLLRVQAFIPSYRASLLGGVVLGDKANCSLEKGDSLSPRGKLPAPAVAP